MAKSRKDKLNAVAMVSMYILMLIRKESAGASILRTSWNCGREKLN